MNEGSPIYERDRQSELPDPDAVPIRDRKVYTQPYDLVVDSLIHQIKGGTIFLQPLSARPGFQRRYVWTDVLASRLVESILLNVPIPPCYLSQNDEFELDVIDGQQRLYSIYRYMDNQFALVGLEVLKDLNGSPFHKLAPNLQRKLRTHTLRCVAVTNESHPEIKFDVFQRLNTNTVPLNAQELRNCVYRGSLNELLKEVVTYGPWLRILGRKKPDDRMRDEELALRFFAFRTLGLSKYFTPQKNWLNEAADKGRTYPDGKIMELNGNWETAVDVALLWLAPKECFRRIPVVKASAVNRALFDLTMQTAARVARADAQSLRKEFRGRYTVLLADAEFSDLISRAVDHKKRTLRRFELWEERIERGLA